MNKKEQIDGKIKELMDVAAEPDNKTTATLVLSSFTATPELVGCTIAIEGSLLSLTAVILKSMYDSDILRDAVMGAAAWYVGHDEEVIFGQKLSESGN